ncbi:MAG: hypothetical protein MHM6MM_002767 [Cercozoa sp. M6MM]
MRILWATFAAATLLHAHTTFFDDFSTFDRDWTVSKWKGDEQGVFRKAAANWHVGDAQRGIQTAEDNKFYAAARKLETPFTTKDKPLVIQYAVKFPQDIDCGGGYLKLLPKLQSDDGLGALESFGGDSPYVIMFGPDICGNTKKTHVILA